MATILKRKKVNITSIEGVRIMPGNNHFSDEQVKKMKENPAWESMLECGVHEIVSAPKESSDGQTSMEPAQSITEMNVKNAKKVISETFDRRSLEIMKEEEDQGEKRKGVFDAIDAQLAKIAPSNPDKNEEDED